MSSHDVESAGATRDEQLGAVADAARARLRATTDDDAAGSEEARKTFNVAVSAAMDVGCSLRDIMAAETQGKAAVQAELRSDTLKRVQRTANQIHEAKAAHDAAVARALRLELSTRDIAQAAGVAHGTIRAMAHRTQTPGAATGADDATASDEHAVEGGAGESVDSI